MRLAVYLPLVIPALAAIAARPLAGRMPPAIGTWLLVASSLALAALVRVGSGQVVVTEDDAADAYTLPGWPCRIVITSGMLRALTHPERRALLAHERAHACGAHYLLPQRLLRLLRPPAPARPPRSPSSHRARRACGEPGPSRGGSRPCSARHPGEACC